MSIQSAIYFGRHSGFDQVEHCIITLAKLFYSFVDISGVFFYIICIGVKGECPPSFMQVFDISPLSREVPTEMSGEFMPVTTKLICIQTMVPFPSQML